MSHFAVEGWASSARIVSVLMDLLDFCARVGAVRRAAVVINMSDDGFVMVRVDEDCAVVLRIAVH